MQKGFGRIEGFELGQMKEGQMDLVLCLKGEEEKE